MTLPEGSSIFPQIAQQSWIFNTAIGRSVHSPSILWKIHVQRHIIQITSHSLVRADSPGLFRHSNARREYADIIRTSIESFLRINGAWCRSERFVFISGGFLMCNAKSGSGRNNHAEIPDRKFDFILRAVRALRLRGFVFRKRLFNRERKNVKRRNVSIKVHFV